MYILYEETRKQIKFSEGMKSFPEQRDKHRYDRYIAQLDNHNMHYMTSTICTIWQAQYVLYDKHRYDNVE